MDQPTGDIDRIDQIIADLRFGTYPETVRD